MRKGHDRAYFSTIRECAEWLRVTPKRILDCLLSNKYPKDFSYTGFPIKRLHVVSGWMLEEVDMPESQGKLLNAILGVS